MKRTKTKVPGIYGRGDKYIAVVTYKDGFGRERQKWFTRNSFRAAQGARRTFLNELDRGIAPDGGKITLAEYIEQEWMPEVESTRRPATVTTYRRMLDNHILKALGGLRLKDIGQKQLRAFYSQVPTLPLARLSHAILSSALTYAAKEKGLISANPCATVRPPKLEKKEARHLDLPDAQRMLELVRGGPLEGAVILGLVGGLRIGEVCAVRWSDVDLDTGALIVRGSFWGPTKSGKMRGLTIPVGQTHALRRHKFTEAERLLRLGVRQDDETFVVTNELGGQLAPSALRRAFGRFCRAHGFDISFHSLRHTAAVLMLTSGVDVKTAASRLGHADPALLFTTYSHFIQSADQAAADKLGALLGG